MAAAQLALSCLLVDPTPTLPWPRDHARAQDSPFGYWLLTRYDDVLAAFRYPRLPEDRTKKGNQAKLASRRAMSSRSVTPRSLDLAADRSSHIGDRNP